MQIVATDLNSFLSFIDTLYSLYLFKALASYFIYKQSSFVNGVKLATIADQSKFKIFIMIWLKRINKILILFPAVTTRQVYKVLMLSTISCKVVLLVIIDETQNNGRCLIQIHNEVVRRSERIFNL